MVSEEVSTRGGKGGLPNADGAQPGNQAIRGQNRAPRGCGQPPINRNAHGNASNIGNLGPSQRGNARANGGIHDRINQIVTVVTQVPIMLTQVNGIPIPRAVQQHNDYR